MELKEKIEEGWNPLCVDVRTPEEIKTQGQLPYDCVNIPHGTSKGESF
ncbi:MAG: hypothetical protein WBJ86_02440 [Acetomicrobium sp.]